MSSNKPEDMVGHDPLAWIAEIAEEPELEAEPEVIAEKSETKQEPVEAEPVVVEPVEVVIEEKTEAISSNAKQGVQGMVVTFEGDLGIAQVADMHKRLVAVLQTASECSLDMSEVSHVDTASLQVLCAFVSDAKKLDVSWQWHGVPESVTKTANALGLSEALGLEA
ncbi:MAG: STAS domain-containing protein [Mariprofundaceae bacterium]